MADLLSVPVFARLDDYFGVWSVEPTRFAALRQIGALIAVDFKAHKEEQPVAQTESVPTQGGKAIALIRAEGLLMKSRSSMGGTSTIQMRREIRAAAADPDVNGILLAIDSPGGTVSGMVDLAADVKAAKKVKPVWAHIEDLGASAAYWLASGADRITANAPTAMVGSIGTMQVIYDVSAAMEKDGVKTLLFRTGPLKGMGVAGAPVTDEQQAHMQGMVESVQESFDSAVRTGRSLSAKELQAVRHGGVMLAPAAKEAKLIDAISPLSKTINDFSQAIKSGTAGRQQSAALSGADLFPRASIFGAQRREPCLSNG